MPLDRIHDIVVDDERDDPLLPATLRALQGGHLVNVLDELRLAPAMGAGVRAVFPVGSS